MRRCLLAAAIMLAGPHSAVAAEWIVEAHYPDQAALNRAASKFQHVIVDAKRQTLRVDTDDAGIAALEDAGLAVTIDAADTARLRGFYATMQAALQSGVAQRTEGGYPSIPGFACYRTLEGTYQTMDELAAAQPGLAKVEEIGPTWQKTQDAGGYEMRTLRITNLATAEADPERPRFVAFGSIHAREYTPAELLTRMAEWLVNGYGSDPQATWLVDHVDFRFILQANPDGRKQAETGILWRKNTNTIDGACAGTPTGSRQPGIDLNRNFPFHWNTTATGSSGYTCDETYRGPIAGSEPETQNLVRYVAGTPTSGSYVGGALPDRRNGDLTGPAPEDYAGIFFDIHSYSQLVLWSWGDTYTPAPNDTTLRTLGRRLAWFNGYTPQASVELYPTDGTTDDTFYGALGAPSYTIELGVDFFESCGSFLNSTLPMNLAALTYAARAAQAPYRLPAGPDTIAVTAAQDLVALGTPIQLQARLDSNRFNNSNGTQTPHPIASAAAYIDLPPWAAGAQPIALSASDGAFDATAEDVQGTLAGTLLPSGRHLVFVQGVDDMGQAGTPDATFVEVAAAESIGQLTGAITTGAEGTPLAATLTATNTTTGEQRSAATDPADGRYARTMYAGTVDLRASARGYLDEELHDVVLGGGQSLTRNFRLLPVCTLFSDDLENGGAAWTAQSPWVMSNSVPGNPTQVWHTPNYGPNLSRSLTLASAIDATGYAAIGIDFDDRCATEAGYDHGNVEYSTNDGSTWTGVYACSGRTNWQTNHVDLPPAADGSSALWIRFRLQSDQYVSDAGWAVDNIRITAGGQACRDQQVPADEVIFANGFEQAAGG